MTKITTLLREDISRREAAAEPYWQTFHEFSKKLGDTSRTFAFAGIALIWVFRTVSASGKPILPFDLAIAGFFFIAGLSAELLRLFLTAFTAQYHAAYAYADGDVEGLRGIVCKFLHSYSLDTIAILVEMGCVLVGFGFTLHHIAGVIIIG